jgi:hypothetical protein
VRQHTHTYIHEHAHTGDGGNSAGWPLNDLVHWLTPSCSDRNGILAVTWVLPAFRRSLVCVDQASQDVPRSAAVMPGRRLASATFWSAPDAVQELTAQGADQAHAGRVHPPACTAVRRTVVSAAWEAAPKDAVKFDSRRPLHHSQDR